VIGSFKKAIWLGAASLAALLPNAARADTYAYDVYGRLISVHFSAGGSITYTYDSAGNRTVVAKSP
jgi:hypothetical protein